MEINIDTLLGELIFRHKAAPAASDLLNPELPAEVRAAAQHGWRIFIVTAMSRHASTAAIVERIGQATSNCAQFEREFAANPVCGFGLVTGADSGVFAVEVDPSYGGLARCICDAVRGTVDEDYRWRTLASTTGKSLLAFFEYAPAWRDSLVTSCIAPGVKVYADNDWVFIPPSTHPGGITHAYLDPEMPVREAPRQLIKLAFGPPPKDPAPAAPRIPPQPAKPASYPNIPRTGYPAFSAGALRGIFHSSRRY